ncbi:unnamed protein product [Closterium sp. NIES-53]
MMDLSMGLWRYPGSLTTPGCDEIVEWRMLGKAKFLSVDQRRQLRQAESVVVIKILLACAADFPASPLRSDSSLLTGRQQRDRRYRRRRALHVARLPLSRRRQIRFRASLGTTRNRGLGEYFPRPFHCSANSYQVPPTLVIIPRANSFRNPHLAPPPRISPPPAGLRSLLNSPRTASPLPDVSPSPPHSPPFPSPLSVPPPHIPPFPSPFIRGFGAKTSAVVKAHVSKGATPCSTTAPSSPLLRRLKRSYSVLNHPSLFSSPPCPCPLVFPSPTTSCASVRPLEDLDDPVAVDGVLGLGARSYSVLNQLAAAAVVPPAFALCFDSTSNSGFLSLGAPLVPPNVTTTDYVGFDNDTRYFLPLTQIRVGQTAVKGSAAVAKLNADLTGGFTVKSSYLSSGLRSAVHADLVKLVFANSSLRRADMDVYSCVHLTVFEAQDMVFPSIFLDVKEGSLEITPNNYLIKYVSPPAAACARSLA